jgi:hypothetical protein
MRPRGEYRQILFGALAQPGTARALAERTQIGYEVTRRTLDNMCRSVEAVVIDEIRVEGVKRRVPLYGLPNEAEIDANTEALEVIAAASAGSWAEFE